MGSSELIKPAKLELENIKREIQRIVIHETLVFWIGPALPEIIEDLKIKHGEKPGLAL